MSKAFGQSIASIYDAAINSALWDVALDNCVQQIGCLSSTLLIFDDDAVSGVHVDKVSCAFREVPEDIASHYRENLIHYEREGWQHVLGLPKQTLVTDKDVWPQPDSEIVQREDFAYLLRHVGFLRRVVAKLNDNPSWLDAVAFQFDKRYPTVPADQMATIRELLPHLAKASELCRSFSILQAQYKAVLSALDFVEVGLCITLGSGRVVVANAEAEQILDDGDGIKLTRDRTLQCVEALTHNYLTHAIATTSATASGGNSCAEFNLSIKRPSGDRNYIVEVSPLSDSAAELEANLRGSLVMIVDPENSSPIKIDRLAGVFGFTEAEIQITRYLLDGLTNSQIAEQRGVSLETVKTQVASVLHKSQTRRRSELIRLAVKISPPIKLKSG